MASNLFPLTLSPRWIHGGSSLPRRNCHAPRLSHRGRRVGAWQQGSGGPSRNFQGTLPGRHFSATGGSGLEHEQVVPASAIIACGWWMGKLEADLRRHHRSTGCSSSLRSKRVVGTRAWRRGPLSKLCHCRRDGARCSRSTLPWCHWSGGRYRAARCGAADASSDHRVGSSSVRSESSRWSRAACPNLTGVVSSRTSSGSRCSHVRTAPWFGRSFPCSSRSPRSNPQTRSRQPSLLHHLRCMRRQNIRRGQSRRKSSKH